MKAKIPRTVSLCALAGAVTLATATSAHAGLTPLIEAGLYQLNNHPDGNAANPLYGLRLDKLYQEQQSGPDAGDPIDGSTVFTFDFDHPDSDVFMRVTNGEIQIFGSALGGRDIGASYAGDEFSGVYDFDFTYDVGLGVVPGDDDLQVIASTGANSGVIETPLGDSIDLFSKAKGEDGFSFRLGDEDEDTGHRGFAGISGWGWLATRLVRHDDRRPTQDWLFTAKLIPAPGTAAAFAGMGVMGMRRRRR